MNNAVKIFLPVTAVSVATLTAAVFLNSSLTPARGARLQQSLPEVQTQTLNEARYQLMVPSFGRVEVQAREVSKHFGKGGYFTDDAARFHPGRLFSLTTFIGLMSRSFEQSARTQFLTALVVLLGFGVMFATLIPILLIPLCWLIGVYIKSLMELATVPSVMNALWRQNESIDLPNIHVPIHDASPAPRAGRVSHPPDVCCMTFSRAITIHVAF